MHAAPDAELQLPTILTSCVQEEAPTAGQRKRRRGGAAAAAGAEEGVVGVSLAEVEVVVDEL